MKTLFFMILITLLSSNIYSSEHTNNHHYWRNDKYYYFDFKHLDYLLGRRQYKAKKKPTPLKKYFKWHSEAFYGLAHAIISCAEGEKPIGRIQISQSKYITKLPQYSDLAKVTCADIIDMLEQAKTTNEDDRCLVKEALTMITKHEY